MLLQRTSPSSMLRNRKGADQRTHTGSLPWYSSRSLPLVPPNPSRFLWCASRGAGQKPGSKDGGKRYTACLRFFNPTRHRRRCLRVRPVITKSTIAPSTATPKLRTSHPKFVPPNPSRSIPHSAPNWSPDSIFPRWGRGDEGFGDVPV